MNNNAFASSLLELTNIVLHVVPQNNSNPSAYVYGGDTSSLFNWIQSIRIKCYVSAFACRNEQQTTRVIVWWRQSKYNRCNSSLNVVAVGLHEGRVVSWSQSYWTFVEVHEATKWDQLRLAVRVARTILNNGKSSLSNFWIQIWPELKVPSLHTSNFSDNWMWSKQTLLLPFVHGSLQSTEFFHNFITDCQDIVMRERTCTPASCFDQTWRLRRMPVIWLSCIAIRKVHELTKWLWRICAWQVEDAYLANSGVRESMTLTSMIFRNLWVNFNRT